MTIPSRAAGSPTGAAPSPDEAIVDGLRRGNGSSGLELAWRQYAPRVRAWLVSYGCPRGDLDEAITDTFGLLLSRRTDPHNGNVRARLRTRARFVAANYRRGERRRIQKTESAGDVWQVDPPCPPDEALAHEHTQAAYAAFRAILSPGDAVLLESLGATPPEAELIAEFQQASGRRLTVVSLRRRRIHVRDRLAAFLRSRGFTL